MDSGTALRVGLQLDTVLSVCSYVYVPSYEWMNEITTQTMDIQSISYNLLVYLRLPQT